MNVGEAIQWVQDAVSSLAALPPPHLQQDDQGFSGVTDSPLREYLRRVISGEALSIEDHYAAVSYLREHRKTQLNSEAFDDAREAIAKAWRAVQSPETLEAVRAVGSRMAKERATAKDTARAEAEAAGKKTRKRTVDPESVATDEERALRAGYNEKISGDAYKGTYEDGMWAFRYTPATREAYVVLPGVMPPGIAEVSEGFPLEVTVKNPKLRNDYNPHGISRVIFSWLPIRTLRKILPGLFSSKKHTMWALIISRYLLEWERLAAAPPADPPTDLMKGTCREGSWQVHAAKREITIQVPYDAKKFFRNSFPTVGNFNKEDKLWHVPFSVVGNCVLADYPELVRMVLLYRPYWEAALGEVIPLSLNGQRSLDELADREGVSAGAAPTSNQNDHDGQGAQGGGGQSTSRSNGGGSLTVSEATWSGAGAPALTGDDVETPRTAPLFRGNARRGDTVERVSWSWSPDKRAFVEFRGVPFDFYRYELSPALRGKSLAFVSGTLTIPSADIPEVISALESLRKCRGWAQALAEFFPVWSYIPPLTEASERLVALILNRYRFMLHPQIRDADDELIRVFRETAGILENIQSRQMSANLGPFGSWRVVPAKNGEISGQSILEIAVPFAISGWHQKRVTRVGEAYKEAGNYWQPYELRSAPLICRLLDLVSPPLAMSIRLAWLTHPTECTELDQLSGVTRIADLPSRDLQVHVEALYNTIRPKLKREARDYQKIGAAYAHFSKMRFLLADDMGVGKTGQAILALLANPAEYTPALVVAPASVCSNWPNEIRLWTNDLQGEVLENVTSPIIPKVGKVYVVSWAELAKVAEWGDPILKRFKTVILDEVHYAKNINTARGAAALGVAERAPYLIGISGTPMENRVSELFPILHMISPGSFPDLQDFKERYASKGKRKVGGITFTDDRGERLDPKAAEQAALRAEYQAERLREWEEAVALARAEKKVPPPKPKDIGGDSYASAAMLQELKESLRCFMIRRLKADVLTELPPKVRRWEWLTLPPNLAAIYTQIEAECKQYIADSWRLGALRTGVRMFRREMEQREKDLQEGHSLPDAVREQVIQETFISMLQADREPDISVALEVVGYLRRAVGVLKAPVVGEAIVEMFTANPNVGPVLCFVAHKAPLKKIKEILEGAGLRVAVVDGGVPTKVRSARIEGTQQGKYDVLLGTSAVAEGVNLPQASTVVFGERFWVPSKETQMEDRAHRMGQLRTVDVAFMMAKNTFDEHIYQLVDRKREEISEVIGENQVDDKSVTKRMQQIGDVQEGIAELLTPKDFPEIPLTLDLFRKAIQHAQYGWSLKPLVMGTLQNKKLEALGMDSGEDRDAGLRSHEEVAQEQVTRANEESLVTSRANADVCFALFLDYLTALENAGEDMTRVQSAARMLQKHYSIPQIWSMLSNGVLPEVTAIKL